MTTDGSDNDLIKLEEVPKGYKFAHVLVCVRGERCGPLFLSRTTVV